MAIDNIYHLWGFTDNPFSILALEPNSEGDRLLIGRDSEVKALIQRLATPPNIPTVEGLHGIGKTSLVNVTLYRCFQECLKSSGRPLLIPCRERFQLNEDIEPGDFAFQVLLEVAQTLIENKNLIREHGHELPEVEKIDRWLNAPELGSTQASEGTVSGGYSRSASAMGFNDSGFKKVVKRWLRQIFPTASSGGVMCILDNIEIMRSSVRAREVAEALRDPVLSIPGIRWVLCGALGVVYGIARSPRLQGILTAPVVVGPIESQEPGEILDSRLEAFALVPGDVFMPVGKEEFAFLFRLMRGHIRNVLSEANSFCHWIADNNWRPKISSQPAFSRALFELWIKEKSTKALLDNREFVRDSSWQRLDEIVKLGGIVALRDLLTGSLEEDSRLRSEIRELDSAGLLTNVQDASREIRQMIHVTAEGWFAHYATLVSKAGTGRQTKESSGQESARRTLPWRSS